MLVLCAGCVSPVALHRAVLAYDEEVARVTREQLLLNIIRARDSHPVHFTSVPSVAATFLFQASAGITPPEGDARGLVAPLINATVAENPTITIVPMEGEEFTQRLLTPLDESRVLSLVNLGTDINMLFRLTAASFRLFEEGGDRRVRNDPAEQSEYQLFRRVVMRLALLHRRQDLHIQRVMAQPVWEGSLREAPGSADIVQAIESSYTWQYDAQSGSHRLTRPRILLSNYPANQLDPAELVRLSERANEWPPNEILVDLRPGFPGGEDPVQGTIQLRSFDAILRFLGTDLSVDGGTREHEETRPPGPVVDPDRLLAIQEFKSKPSDATIAIQYEEQGYAIVERTWDLEVFRLLYQLFQMTVKPVQAPVPGITIAK